MDVQNIINEVIKEDKEKRSFTFPKMNLYQKARANKFVVTSFWIFFGFLFFGCLVMANTFISNSGTSTFSSNIDLGNNNLTATMINEVFYVQAGNESDIQPTINSACAAGGGLVDLPKGTYEITSEIVINCSSLNFQGQGQSTIIEIQNEGQNGIVLGSATTTETKYSSIKNMRIVGKVGSTNTSSSIIIKNHDFGNFENLFLKYGDVGIEITALGSGGHNILNKFDVLNIEDMNREGILITNNISGGTGNYNNGHLFTNLYMNQNGIGINISRADLTTSGEVAHHKFTNGYIETQTVSDKLVVLERSTDNGFMNIMFDGTGDTEIFIDGNSHKTKFIGTEIDGSISDSSNETIIFNSDEGLFFGNLTSNVAYIRSTGSSKLAYLEITTDSERLLRLNRLAQTYFDFNITTGFPRKLLISSGNSRDGIMSLNDATSEVQVYKNLVIGNGSSQFNITMTSPDGTEFNCNVNNSGSFLCS